MSKILTVNPDLFKLPGSRRGSRKKTSDDSTNEIRVRAPRETKKQTLTNKNALLRFIRDQQHRNEQSIGGNTKSANDVLTAAAQEYATDFDDSLQFLMDIANKVSTQSPPPPPNPPLSYITHGGGGGGHNHTLKTNHQPHYVSDIPTDTNVSMVFPDGGGGNALRLAAPTYGCLKGGTKPTYRQYYHLDAPPSAPHNVTQRHVSAVPTSMHDERKIRTGFAREDSEAIAPFGRCPSTYSVGTRNGPEEYGRRPGTMEYNLSTRSTHPTHPYDHPIPNTHGRVGGDQRVYDRKVTDLVKLANQPAAPKLIYPKQKRTVRRTFHIGKSKTRPQVSVLVSNRTIRRNITTKNHELKQTPIHDIKMFLIKRGLIRVGTSAPNNVLRQMYESATMLCGDVYNHNADTLLYNFFNADPAMSKI